MPMQTNAFDILSYGIIALLVIILVGGVSISYARS